MRRHDSANSHVHRRCTIFKKSRCPSASDVGRVSPLLLKESNANMEMEMALHGSLTDVFLSPSPVSVYRETALNPELLMRLVDATLQFVILVVVVVIAVMVIRAISRSGDLARLTHSERLRFEEARAHELQSLLELFHQQQADLARVFQLISTQGVASAASMGPSEGAWSKQSEQALYATFDSLSPTEVAIAVLTSPPSFPSLDRSPTSDRFITATAKETYVWAGAVAYIMENRPETSERQILEAWS